MYEFSIRVTGSSPPGTDDSFREKLNSYLAELVSAGCTVAHASLNGSVIHVHVDKVDVKAADPDRWLSNMDDKIKRLAAVSESTGEPTS